MGVPSSITLGFFSLLILLLTFFRITHLNSIRIIVIWHFQMRINSCCCLSSICFVPFLSLLLYHYFLRLHWNSSFLPNWHFHYHCLLVLMESRLLLFASCVTDKAKEQQFTIFLKKSWYSFIIFYHRGQNNFMISAWLWNNFKSNLKHIVLII